MNLDEYEVGGDMNAISSALTHINRVHTNLMVRYFELGKRSEELADALHHGDTERQTKALLDFLSSKKNNFWPGGVTDEVSA